MIGAEQKEFLIAEFNSLRGEIRAKLARIREDERNALIISGAIWVWVAAGFWKTSYGIIVFIPAALSILFSLKSYAEWQSIKETGAYIINIENLFELGHDVGWQHYLKGEREHLLVKWSTVYWSLLISGNFIFALLIVTKVIVY
ncbi:MAG: hypothetical protein U9N18_03960 [Campylobacterota bacterium]|nr:hypothetical protein [Campylobacterota bacterium]